MSIKILDLQTGIIRDYGTNCHDALRIGRDGRGLYYANLQNGDGSQWGDYRFVMDDDKTPEESQTADALHGETYFNIGGFGDHINRVSTIGGDSDVTLNLGRDGDTFDRVYSIGIEDNASGDKWTVALTPDQFATVVEAIGRLIKGA